MFVHTHTHTHTPQNCQNQHHLLLSRINCCHLGVNIIVPNTMQYIQLPNTMQYIQLPNTMQYLQLPNTMQYIQLPNTMQYIQLPNTMQYIQLPNTMQYIQLPNSMQYSQLQTQIPPQTFLQFLAFHETGRFILKGSEQFTIRRIPSHINQINVLPLFP